MALHNTNEQQARNELENAERLGNEQGVTAAKKRLLALGIDVDAERAAAKRAAAPKAEKESAPQGRSTRKGDKA